jgi:uncharacterized protein
MKELANLDDRQDAVEIIYSSERWDFLKILREKACTFLRALEKRHIPSIAHGSIARGDVKKNSDIDIFVPTPPSSFQVEYALEQSKINVVSRMIIQATPSYAMKAYLEIDDVTTISFPLMNMRRVEREFYRFGGEVNLKNLQVNLRVAGVDKRLMFIEPSSNGHFENTILGKEEYAAKRLGISVETVLDRIHTLTRRDVVGRTGVFIKKELQSDETFEFALKRLADENPAVRRRLIKSA